MVGQAGQVNADIVWRQALWHLSIGYTELYKCPSLVSGLWMT
jgi:hypothetical protein